MSKKYPGVYEDKSKKTNDGRCCWYVATYKDIQGKEKQKVSGMFNTQAEAFEAKQKFLMKHNYPIHRKFSLIAEEYFNNYKDENKDNSYHNLYSEYQVHIKDFFKDKYIDKISYNDIIAWKNYMLEKTYDKKTKDGKIEKKHYSKNYLDKAYSILSSIYKYAMPRYDLNTNIVQLVGPFKFKNDEVIKDEEKLKYITLENFNIYISVIKDILWQTLFTFLMYAGTRIGEALALTWEDIDFKSNIISITKTIDKRGKITNTKNRKNRKIKMSKTLSNLLYRYKLEMMKYSDFKETWFVFGGPTSLPRTTITRKKDYYFDLVNENRNENEKINRITVHEFRHSHISMLINEYVKKCITLNLKIDAYKFFLMMSDRMGHTVEEMMKTYMHLFPTVQDEIIELLDNM